MEFTERQGEYVVKTWETVPCLFCGETKHFPHERFGPDGRYAYVQCVRCDLVYQARRPKYDEEFVQTAYAEYNTVSHHIKNKGRLDEGERRLVDKYKITLRQLEQRLGRKGKLLDVGCGTGLFLVAAREEGWGTTGVDISELMVNVARDAFGLDALCGQLHELDFSPQAPFDAIYCSHVIEHIPNPRAWMECFRQWLAKDGVLCLNVPNQYSVDRVTKRALKKIGLVREKWAPWRTPDHLYEPHAAPMLEFLRRSGFSVIDYFTYSSREKQRESVTDRWLHHGVKWGSKLRFFARPI